MQIDMHYYGTYVISRLAGINQESARIIATAAQFVDESISDHPLCFLKDGSFVQHVITAHHALSIENIDQEDQRLVWVPFHFLPGGKGQTLTEKLICVKDSLLARQMLEHALENSSVFFSRELMGITSHTYLDTFAHYGFSGVSSRFNKIENDSICLSVDDLLIKKYLEEKAIVFFKKYGGYQKLFQNIRNIISLAAEVASGALGHGAVATFPDRPYLKWNFKYENIKREPGLLIEQRDNVDTYLQGCEKLFQFFKFYSAKMKAYQDKNSRDIQFSHVKASIKSILKYEGRKKDRIKQWEQAFQSKVLADFEEEIPPPLSWQADLITLNGKESALLKNYPIYRFFLAADFHKTYILRCLLPENDIYVV